MKDYIRDYATAAFRFYAKNEMSAEYYRQKLFYEALENANRSEGSTGISKPTETAIMKAETAVSEKIAEIYDMEAVEKVIAELKVKYRNDIVKAIDIVYFKDNDKELNKSDIQNRVIEASIAIPAGERSIYRWLKQARELFAIKRGLRVEGWQ